MSQRCKPDHGVDEVLDDEVDEDEDADEETIPGDSRGLAPFSPACTVIS